MITRMRRSTVWSCLAVPAALLAAATFGQYTAAKRQPKNASQTAHITKFFIAEATADSGYETGPLHVLYSDGTEILQTLPPLKASSDKEIVYNAVGFSGAALAADQRTLAWEINFRDTGESYSIPLSVVVFQDKKPLHTFEQGQLVWSWMFVEGGKQVAIVFGPAHGPEVGDYRLYDVKTGKQVAEVPDDEDTQSLKADAPDWAKQLQVRLHNPASNAP